MISIDQLFTDMIGHLAPGGQHEGLPADQALAHVQGQVRNSNYAEWTPRRYDAPRRGIFDVVMQRYDYGAPGDVQQKIVRDVHVEYPNEKNYPVYYVIDDGIKVAIEVGGWYVTYEGNQLEMPPKVPHVEI